MKNKNQSNLQFLQGGGEMGSLIREKDWSNTPLGPPQTWPQSLRISLSLVLNSSFPMFIWWGPQLTCFYNDAYRPSLGNNGKHPSILGMPGKESWPEIWDIIKPLIDKVINENGSVWFEDKLVPIYRNGKIEDVYWTFSYSALMGDDDKVAGVLVTCTETTEKVNSAKKLVDTNTLFLNNIKQAPVAMCLFKGEKHVVEIANNRMLEVWGKTADQVLNKPIFEGLPEAKGQGLEKLIDDVMLTGQRYEAFERPVNLPRNGNVETTYINFAYEPFREADGTITGIIAVAIEVTFQVKARKTIEEGKRLLEAITQNTPDLIYVWDLNYRFTYANDALLKMWGLTWEQSIGKRLLEVGYEPWHAEMHEREIDQVIATKETVRGQVSFPHATLGKRIYDYILVPVIDHNGNVEAIAGTTRDISQELETNRLIHENEKRFRFLADNMPAKISNAKPNGEVIYFNTQWIEFSGYTFEELRDFGYHKMMHPDEIDEFQKRLMHAATTGTALEMEMRFMSKEGHYVWHLNVAAPIKDENNVVQMWVGVTTDIEQPKRQNEILEKAVEERTLELKQANEQLFVNNEELNKKNKELQAFAYISSHDLQEPLRKIQTFASRVMNEEKQNLSSKGLDLFARMQNAAERMQKLIDDLLAYSRTNIADRKYVVAHLGNIVAEVKADLAEDIEKQNAVIEATELCELPVILFQFRQLLLNLISNSLKFTAPGRTPHITITSTIAHGAALNHAQLQPNTNYCHIKYTDNGIGFDQQYSQKIFELFQRLHGKQEYAGTGIGLSIVKKIVDNHNGFITATGKVNEGATFDIYIPFN